MPQNPSTREMLAQVNELVSKSVIGGTVTTRLRDLLVEREIADRVNTLDNALNKLRDLKRDLNKIKPDQVAVSPEGGKTESFSKAKWEEREKVVETISKLEDLVERALSNSNADWGKLKEVVAK